MDEPLRIALLALVLGTPALGATAKPPKPPRDAPYCARPAARQVFVSPMGEAFRAPAGAPYPSAAWFAGADRDHDRRLDRAETIADARRFFHAIDLDGDGRLTPEEVGAYERDVAPEIALYAGARESERRRGGGSDLGFLSERGDQADYSGPLGAGRYAWLNIPEPVASADTDIDRLVSAQEFAGAAGRRFDALDTARGGSLALADFGRTPQQVAIEGPCRPRPKPKRGERRGPFDDPPPGGGEEGRGP